jgi:hypothetical protein
MESLSARQLNSFISLECRYRNTFCFYQYVGYACLHGLRILMSHLEDVGLDRRIILEGCLRYRVECCGHNSSG